MKTKLLSVVAVLAVALLILPSCATRKLIDPDFIKALGENTNSIELDLDSPHFGKLKYRRNMDRFSGTRGKTVSIVPTTKFELQETE